MRKMTFLRRALLLLPVLFSAQWGWCHGIDTFARVEGGQIVGTMVFADGTPVADIPVRAFGPDGEVLEETRTDSAGSFTLPIRFPVRYRLVGEAGQGHRGLFTVPESEVRAGYQADSSSGGDSTSEGVPSTAAGVTAVDTAALESAIARQLGPLRDQLHEHESKVRFRDVFGGIGYVFGLAGIFALLKRRAGTTPPGLDS